MLSLELSRRAKKDLDKIAKYTVKTWGQLQAVAYSAKLKRQFQLICSTPQIGHQKPDITEGILCVGVGRHLIFYEIEGDTIYVLRVLHDSMDYARQLQ